MGRYSVMVKTQHCGQAYTHTAYEGCDTPYAYVLDIDLGAILNGSIVGAVLIKILEKIFFQN